MEKQKTNQMEEIISAGQLLRILNSNPKEVSTLCQKACLKPKKDGFGNIYFSKDDIDVLKKVKELYKQTKELQEEKKRAVEEAVKEMTTVDKENNFLQRMKQRVQRHEFNNIENALEPINAKGDIARSIQTLENNIVDRISNVLSEKMDGLDEIVVELIRTKTENETLRQKLNELNKENFNLKSENACFKSVGLGFYVKRNTDDFMM